MSKLKERKYVGILGILLLIVGIIGLITYGRVDKYKGLIKIKEAKVLSSVGNTSFVMSKGTEEVEYEMEYTLDEIEGVEKRDVIIEGKINNEYATFKEIEGRNITSTLKENGKEIEIKIKDVRLGEEQRITIKVQVTNAPNKEEIIPEIKIKETTGEYTRVNTEAIKVETNSVEGIVYDENKVPVTDIELSINKNGREIKRTYTKEDGRFIFSDLEEGEYEIKVEEEVYELEGSGKTREENERLELRVKEVDKFNIETHKYIEKLRLVVNGKEENYTYKDAEKVIENVKNAKSISGEIEYRITVENKGEKETVVERVIDEPGEGLEFKASKNTGWEEEEGILKYKPIEGSSLKGKEKREIKLVLSITKTNEIKEYINKLNTKGEIKEKVVYVIDGKIVREESVIEGERIEKPNFGIENLDGWYTDTNYTNKYKFSKEVNKDIILYAKTKAEEYTVRYIDEGNIVKEEKVREGEKATGIENPSKTGYTFKCWTLENSCYDFNKKVTKNIDLISEYEVIKFNIRYNLNGGKLEEGKTNPKEYTIETPEFTLNNPLDKRDNDGDITERFVGWKGSNGNTPSTVVTLPQLNNLGDKEYEAVYEEVLPGRYTITYNLNGGTLEEENPTSYDKNDLPISIHNPRKRGYTFIGWTGSNGTNPNPSLIIPKGTKENLNYTANYIPTEYTITYDIDGGTVEGNPETYTIETPEFTLNNPRKAGHEFKGWTGSNGNVPEIEVTLPDNKLENKNYKANYEINKYTVTYMNGNEKFYEEEVEYNKTAKGTTTNPSKAHNIFLKWVKEDGTEYDFNTPVINNMTLYASYEEVEAPEIKHTPTEWTRNNVEVTITSDHTDYEYMYKVGNGEYKKYTGAFEVEENSTIYAYSIKNEITSVEVTHDITNIDKINPSINSFETTQDPTSITVKVKGQDNESGTAYIKVYLNNENVFSTDEYTGNDTSEKIETYTISNLEQLTTYTVKVEVIDKVGNSTIEEKEVTTSEKHYVARIIGTNNTLFEDESLYINLESLEEGIKYNKNGINCIEKQCTIQMLDNVEETNSVLEGQDITLDLNGKVITGLQEKAFENNGNLQIVDHNEEEIGKITSEGIGIINNGKLIVGENEEELVVSKDEPIIEGSITGVNSPGELHFYDGKIIGGSTTGALKGSAPITPYSYNASVETTGGKEIATLEIIADAEARINSVYYTKAQSAVDESKNGSYEELQKTDLLTNNLINDKNYFFINYNNKLVSNNSHIQNSVANSYTEIDLTNEEQNQMLTINASISSQNGQDIGFATITESTDIPIYSDSDGRFMYISGTINDTNYTKILEKGKKYYLHFGYRKNESVDSGNDCLTINKIYYEPINQYEVKNDMFVNEDSDNYFYVDENNNIVTTNYQVKPMFAHSYIEYDLTDKTSDLVLLFHVTAKNNSYYRRSAIDLTESADDYVHPNDENGHDLYFRYEYDNDYTMRIPAGKKSYLHLTHTNWSDPHGYSYNESFKISDIYYYWDTMEPDTSTITYNQPILNEEPDTVQIIRNITLTNPLEIVETRDVVLDLNGYTLTTSKDDYVVKNSGSLKIIDTDFDNQPQTNLEKYEKELIKYEEDLAKYKAWISSATYIDSKDYHFDYDYTGTYQEFIAPTDGKYNIEAWGAQGGSDSGYGAYTYGEIELKKFDKLYIFVGGRGSTGCITNSGGGWNGGANAGSSGCSRSGGGATDIRLVPTSEVNLWNESKSISSRIMVAAGGAGSESGAASAGGTINGTSNYYGHYATQTSGSGFGYASTPSYDGSGGGGGYYGGVLPERDSTTAGGGSSFISGHTGSIAITSEDDLTPRLDSNNNICEDGTSDNTCSIHYSNKVFSNTNMIAGNSTMPTHDGTDTMEGNSGNGFVKISLNDETKAEVQERLVDENIEEANYPGEPPVLDTNYVVKGNVTSTTSSVIYNDYDALLDVDTGIININKPGEYSAIINKGNLTIGKNGIIAGLQSNNRGITNTIKGDILDGSGTINMTSSSNIAILNESMVEDNIKGYNLSVASSNSYNFYNNGKKDLTLDSIKTSGAGIDIYQNVDNDLDVNNSTLGSTSNESFYSNQSSVESTITFNNCEIYNRVQNRSGSYRKIIINESNLYDSNLGQNVYNYDGVVEINDSELTHKSWNLENYGTMTVSDSVLNANNHSVAAGWNNNMRGILTLNNVDIKTKGTTNENIIYNYNELTIDGGSITNETNNSTGIYNNANGKLVITGNFETSNNLNRGINNENGSLTIGNNDDSVSINYPLIQATGNSIYNGDLATYNYYDGKLVGLKDSALDGIVSDVPTKYDLNVTKGEETETIVLKSEDEEDSEDDFIAQIGDKKYTTLQKAIDDVPNTNTETEIIILKDIESAVYSVIPENKNVRINHNNKNIKAYNEEKYLENNGTLKMTDNTSEITGLLRSYSKNYIENNNVMIYEKINTNPIRTNDAILNNENATLTINSGNIYSYESRVINNSGIMIVNDGKIFASRTNQYESGGHDLIMNTETGEITYNGGEISFIGTGSAINNKNRLIVNDIKVDLYGHYNTRAAGYTQHILNTFINNSSETSYAKVTGGTYGEDGKKAMFMRNIGTAELENVTSNLAGTFTNTKTLSATNVVMNKINYYPGARYTSPTYTYINNSGEMTITGGSYKGTAPSHLVYNTNKLTISGTEFELTGNEGYLMYLASGGEVSIEDSTLNKSATGYSESTLYVGGSTELEMKTSTITNASTNEKGKGIRQEGSSKITLTNVDVTSKIDAAISKSSTGELTITGGDIINETGTYGITNDSTGEIKVNANKVIADKGTAGIYNTAEVTITIGELGGVPSKTKPEVTGKTYGLYNTNSNAIINFYDGIISGETAIKGKVTNLEPGYDIILETDTLEHKYLDKKPVVKNKRTDDEYYTIQEGIDAASNGDTLELQREYTTMPTTETSTNSKSITLDLNGYKIYQNNEYLFNNNGSLTVKSSRDGGQIESNNNSIFINNATLILESGSYDITNTNDIIQNNENATLTIDGGNIYSYDSRVINNSGNMTVNGGKIFASRTNQYESGGHDLIMNTETGEITYNGGEISFIGTGSAINNKNRLIVNDIKVDLYGHYNTRAAGYTQHILNTFINNSSETSYAKVTGGTYGEDGKKAMFMRNIGTAELENVTSNLAGSFTNTKTLSATNVVMNNLTYWGGARYTSPTYTYINNSGEMTITGGSYKGTAPSHLVYNTNKLTISGTEFELTGNEGYLMYLASGGEVSIEDSNLNKSATGYSESTLYVGGSTELEMKTSTITNASTNEKGKGIRQEGSSKITLTNVDVTSKIDAAISKSSTGELTITGGDIINETGTYGITNDSTGEIKVNANKVIADKGTAGIYNTAEVTITIGELGGVPSKTKPEVTGKTYGLYNTNSNATVNFYDGIISGETAIKGKVTNLEPGYDIILETDTLEHKYLDKKPVVKNKRTDDEYYTIQEGIDAASNGDTLELQREYTTMPTTETSTNSKSITLDLNGYKIYQNNEYLFNNNGSLTVKSSRDGGQIESNNNSIFINNATLILESGSYDITNTNDIIQNNENATLTIDGGNIYSYESRVINNSGNMTVNGGKIFASRTNQYESGGHDLIMNTETGEITYNGGEISFIGTGSAINNKNRLIVNDIKVDLYGHYNTRAAGYTQHILNTFINNSSETSYAKVTGGTYGEDGNKAMFMRNIGTAELENVTSNLAGTFTNTKTLSATNVVMNNLTYWRGERYTSPTYTYINNSGEMTITGGSYKGTAPSHLVYNTNKLTISGTEFELTGNEGYLMYLASGGEVSIEGSTIRKTATGYSESTLYVGGSTELDVKTSTITNSSTNEKGKGIRQEGSSKITLTNVDVTSKIDAAISKSSSGELTITGGDIINENGTYAISNEGTGTVNINSGNIISNNGSSIYMNSSGIVNIGEQGGIPSITSPTIYGKNYGIYNNSTTSTLNFYDGIIKGETGSIYGTITDTESGYKEKRDNLTDPDTGVTTIESTLTVIGSTERVAVVNNINFLSLQAAVNYASNNNIENIQLYKSVILEDNIVKPESGSNVKIYLGGNTITEGSYTIGEGIELVEGTAPSASISRFLASITGTEINPRNIIIFEMSDGSKLEANVTYKLYKLTDNGYKIVKLKENELGDYDIGSTVEKMNTARGKLYINQIGEGNYKLVGTDDKEVNFEITSEGISNNIRINNGVRKNRIVETIATLILSLQTGVVRNPYVLMIMILIVIILSFIAYKKYKEGLE